MEHHMKQEAPMSDYILNLLPLHPEDREAFQKTAPDATHIYARRSAVTPQQLNQATVILGAPKPEDLVHCHCLKWMQTMWVGTEEYTAPGILPPGVLLTNSAGSNSQSVAEHMLACLLALCRKLPQCRDNQRQGRWVDVGNMKTISGATVLVVGAGNVGSQFAQRCRALGAHTVGLNRSARQVPGFDELYPLHDRLDDLLPQADVVALVLPHSPETAGLMDARRLGRMKEDAILLSAGRGSVLDQDALAEALRAGRLWGAALDVTQPEPLPPDHPLWTIPNLLLTPHVAGGMRLEITRKNCIRQALENLKRYVSGQPLCNLIQS